MPVKNDILKYVTPKVFYKDLTKMFRLIISFLNREKIKYFLTQGTLLGYHKYGIIMPWEVDIDIMIVNVSAEKFNTDRFANFIEKNHLHKRKLRNTGIIQICYELNKGDKCKLPTIDLSFIEEKNHIYCRAPWCYAKPPDRYYADRLDINEIFPLKKGKLNGLTVYAPNETKKILSKMYPDFENNITLIGFYDDKWIWEKKIVSPDSEEFEILNKILDRYKRRRKP